MKLHRITEQLDANGVLVLIKSTFRVQSLTIVISLAGIFTMLIFRAQQ